MVSYFHWLGAVQVTLSLFALTLQLGYFPLSLFSPYITISQFIMSTEQADLKLLSYIHTVYTVCTCKHMHVLRMNRPLQEQHCSALLAEWWLCCPSVSDTCQKYFLFHNLSILGWIREMFAYNSEQADREFFFLKVVLTDTQPFQPVSGQYVTLTPSSCLNVCKF